MQSNPIQENAQIEAPYLPPQPNPNIVNNYHIQEHYSKLALSTGFLFGFMAGYITHSLLF